MASWLVHMRVAETVAKYFEHIDFEEFLIGNLAPDSGSIVDKKYMPERHITHFKVGKLVSPKRFIDEHLGDNVTGFKLGYLSHLITDFHFTLRWYKTYEELYGPWKDMDLEVKDKVRDERFHWDFVFIEENRVSKGLDSFMNMDKYEYYFSVFEGNQISEKMRDIKTFYSDNTSIPNFNGILLNHQWIDDFIEDVSGIIVKEFREILEV